ncbi:MULTISPECIES: DNA-directed RNA polymerase subunit beta' [Holospora]
MFEAVSYRPGTPTDFDGIRISIASPDQIRSWSYGEVKKPETINYRTFKPEKDGLFCARIFGPIKDYECLCGKYKRMKYRGAVCERCGVEVTQTKVRRERMGHIELASPVAHIWFSRSLPSRIATLLDMTIKTLERILYFEGQVVLDPGLTPLAYGRVLTDAEYNKFCQEYGIGNFVVGSGSQALKEMLENLDFQQMRAKLRSQLEGSVSEFKRKRIIKQLKLVEAFVGSNTRPEWMILDVIPVIPPDLRPLVPLDGGRFATSDLNDLYRRLLNRNNRLKKLMEMQTPDVIIRNEKRMLQEVVDAFFDNGRRGRPITGTNKRPLKSLSDMLRGKHGRFRSNLLGKRVDYSGRSVIVVGPELRLDQCGLPKKMALELFKPYVYAKLERYGLASSVKVAKRMVERERPEIWDILEEVIQERTVLLNRAPTLHRLGIQAFEPVLIEGKAIQLHPLVCAAYNADFDGDQMAVHVPLSLEAQIEARVLMMSTNNILSPASGEPVIVPSKDMVLGLYYLTLERSQEKGEGMAFSSFSEVLMALEKKSVSLHAVIQARVEMLDEQGNLKSSREVTTPGRLIFWDVVPRHPKISFSSLNRNLSSKEINEVIGQVHRFCGAPATTGFADALVQLGFKYATVGGISFGKDDLLVPPEKDSLVKETEKLIQEYHQQYLDGLITFGERYNRITDAWTKCSESVAYHMMERIAQEVPGKPLNSLYLMAVSGARGAKGQLRQLMGMRGLIARHDGTVIEHPIISNFKEGLRSDEYFNSIYGARKGLSDTALKTANAGYLTRRLVDVAQDCVIHEQDCGTDAFIEMRALDDISGVGPSLRERIFGRTLARDIVFSDGTVLLKGTLIDHDTVVLIENDYVRSVAVRSVLKCEARYGVCSMCYGRNLARGGMVMMGEAVGVVAAQSIGEPGTQLTMRTFHSGGTAQRASESSSLDARYAGKIAFRHKSTVVNRYGQVIVVGRSMEIQILDLAREGQELMSFRLPYGSSLLVQEGMQVEQGQRLAEWDPYTLPIIVEQEGTIHYTDLVEGVSLREVLDDLTGITQRIVVPSRATSRGKELRPTLVLKPYDTLRSEVRYSLSVDTVVLATDQQGVQKGDVIARLAKEAFKSRDIVGGLPRIVELFEARRPKEPAVMSRYSGVVAYGKDQKNRRKFSVIPDDIQERPVEYTIPQGRHILVYEGDRVNKGDILVAGNMVPHDILSILGVDALADFLIQEIQMLYRLQGVRINEKHIEVILRQMLQRVEIQEAGGTLFLVGDHITLEELEKGNRSALQEGKAPAKALRILQGITKVSLQTDSFISAASFQETTRVLTDAAVHGKVDNLRGMKENVIAGRLIPAGTGLFERILRQEARVRDSNPLSRSSEQNL